MNKKLSLFLLLSSVGLLTALVAGPVFANSFQQGNDPEGRVIPGRYIVMVQNGVSPAAVAKRHGAAADYVYKSALNRFAGALSPAQVSALRKDEDVLVVEEDRFQRLLDKPTRVDRMEVDKVIDLNSDDNNNAAVTINVDVAVIDTGIDGGHSDLNVGGGMNFAGGPSYKWNDKNGHGTHVAGTVAAKDNNFGVAGVAPGARVWAVRVCNSLCAHSAMIAGINWVAVEKASGIDFAVATMSIGTPDDAAPCNENSDSLHTAICGLVDAGVGFTLAAGNESRLKHAYSEVIAVSAIADFDGMGGGAGSSTCRSDDDDTLANFSNYGPEVDIAAPGTCILSTWKGNSYKTISGTSMATTHVAGAVALYIHANAIVNPATDAGEVNAIKDAIIAAALPEGTDLVGGDVCSYNNEKGSSEPMLLVNGAAFGGNGNCDSGAVTSPATGAISGTVTNADSGATISGATVRVEGTSRSTTTDSSGGYTIIDISVGTYDVIASAAGFINKPASGISVNENTTTTANFALDAAPAGSISGTVTDDAAAPSPIDGATVAVEGTTLFAIIASKSTYTITGVPAGDSIVTASAIGYLPANRCVTVLDNQDVPADFALAESTVTTYHVSNMDLAVNKKGRWHTLKATMTIKDADGVPAPDGVTVTGTISREARTFLRGAETVGGVAVWTLKTDFGGTGVHSRCRRYG